MAKRKGNGKRGGRGGGPGGGGGGARGRGGGGGRGRDRAIRVSHLMDEALDLHIQMYANARLENLETPPHGSGRGHTRNISEQYLERNISNRARGRGFRGRGGGHPEFSYKRRHSDFGGIGASPRDRGRGGRTHKLRPDATLTGLLYEARPLLRPIVFVPSTLNPILFNQDEDLLKPGMEEVDDTEQSHLPTADRVSRVFSGGDIQPMESSSEADNDNTNDDDDEEDIEVVDFNDVGKLFEPTTKSKKISPKKSNREVAEEQFIGRYNNSIPPSISSLHRPQGGLDTLTKIMDENLSTTERSLEDDPHDGPAAVEQSLFYTDIQPTPIPVEIAPTSNPFPSEEFDDDIIVYVAPHPRKGVQTSPEKEPPTNGVPDTSEFTPYIRDAALSLAVASSSLTIEPEPAAQPQPENKTQIPSLSSFSFSFPTPEGKTRGRLRFPPVTIPRLALSWKRKKDILSRKGRKPISSFRIFGAMHEEAQLRDPKEKERRRGDSDLDWGDTDDDDDDRESEHDHAVDRVNGVETPSELVNGNGNVSKKDKGKGKAREVEDEHGMEVDTDMDLNAMQQFVGGLLGENAGRHVTMDDLMDEEQMKLEDEQDTGDDDMVVSERESEGNSDDEDADVERILANEEAMLTSETLEFEDEEEDDGSEDDEDDENQTPRTSFQKRLERLRSKASSSKHDDEYDVPDDYDDYDEMLKRNMLLAEMDGSDVSKNRLSFNDLIESEDLNHTKLDKRKQAEGLPDNLKIQWEKDRLKKAAYKKAREQARLEAAADPLSPKKGGKKGRKAMLAAARADPTIIVLPNRIIDMVTLVQQIKRFIGDEDGRSTMSLPPTNKATRKNIHELAVAFNLKSVSKGEGDARYTTLIKTLRTGSFGIDETKVAKIVRRSGRMGARGDSFVQDRKKVKGKKKERSGGGAQARLPRHRDGDEVGKAAPKLSSSNLGFRMLSMMGWSEGERIGATGGLQDPLTAIIKNTKLGLGASK